jgi:hypothetical protein
MVTQQETWGVKKLLKAEKKKIWKWKNKQKSIAKEIQQKKEITR